MSAALAHAGQQAVELLVAQVDLLGEELADAWLAHPAKARQFGLGGACLVHHRPQHLTPIAHTLLIRARRPWHLGRGRARCGAALGADR
ncbi:MAG: hypothetical protein QOC69_4321 [Mycobacterium sp.]|nr:hypothetical protein [Mycobacterium sp.]